MSKISVSVTDGTNVNLTVSPRPVQTITVSRGNSGTVTSVTGTGEVSGITLSGSGTQDVTLTLGGALNLSSPPIIGDGVSNDIIANYLEAQNNLSVYSNSGNGNIKLYNSNLQYVQLIPETVLNTSYDLTLPTSIGNSGQVLVTDGINKTYWQDRVGSITSTDGSITVTGTTARDLSVASSPNVIVQVRNNTGATLTKGTAVYINGAIGQLPTVTKAQANTDAASAQTLGLMTTDLANNANGYVTIIGLITNINTSAYTDGQQLYLSPTVAGGLTATKPQAPQHLVYVAVVEHAHITQGKLFVKVQNGYELDELHDVQIISPTNGQTITYDAATSLWKNTTPAAGTVTSVTATSPVQSTGGTTPIISMPAATTSTSGYLTNTDWNTFNNKQAAGAYLTTVTADAPLTGSGTSASHLSIPAATTSTSGYLTSTDWNTFNNKQTIVSLSLTNTAAQNTTLIQNACNNQGTVILNSIGSFPVSSTVLIDDNTTVQINAGVELIQDTAVTTPFLFFTNTNYNASPVTAIGNITSVTFGHSMTKCSVTVPNGSVFTVGKYILIKGDTTNAFNGVKYIYSIVGNVITWLESFLSATPTSSGTITVTKANANCSVSGEGRLNGQFANGKVMANSYQDHAIMFNNVLNPFVGGGLEFIDIRKYRVCMANCENAFVNEIYGQSGADGVHYYGPMYGTPVINGVYGSCGDDGAVFQTVDGSAYTQYMPPNSGGSFYNGGRISNVYTLYNGNSGAVVLYPNSGVTSDLGYKMYNNYLVENVGHLVSNTTALNSTASVVVGNNYVDYTAASVASIDSLELNNIRGGMLMRNKVGAVIYIPQVTINSHSTYSGGEFTPVIISDYFKIDLLTSNQPYIVAPTTGVNAYISTNPTTVIGDIVINQPLMVNNYTSAAMPLLGKYTGATGGTINSITANNPQCGLRCCVIGSDGSHWLGTLKINVTNAKSTATGTSLVGIGGSNAANISIDGADTTFAPLNFFGTGVINVSARRVPSGANQIVNTQSNVTIIDYVTSAAPTRTTPTTGGTVSCINKCGYQKQIIAPAGTLAALTLVLPANPINGEIIELVFTQQIIALTVTNGPLLGFTSGGTMPISSKRYVYNAAGTVWL